MPRSTFTDRAVTYAAIGGSLAPDLLQFPPKGYSPLEMSVRLGSGDERYASASASLMTWGVQRGSGIEIVDAHSGTGQQYVGLTFNDDGTPVKDQPLQHIEERFGPDGTSYITAGMSATQIVHVGPLHVKAPVRIVFTIDEPDRSGFVAGTLAGHPLSGEEALVVSRRDDGSVWFTVTSFCRGARWYHRLVWPVVRRQQKRIQRRFLRALHPVGAAS